jgi:hypothetical protein
MASFNRPKAPRKAPPPPPIDQWKEMLPYGLILPGILLQLYGWFWIGFILVITGVVLYNSNLPDPEAMNFVPKLGGSSRWIAVTPTEIGKIKSRIVAMEKLTGGLIEGLAKIMLVISVMGLFLFLQIFDEAIGDATMYDILRALLANLLVVAGSILILASPRTWTPGKIVFKLPVLEKIMGWTKTVGAAEWVREYQLELKKTDKGEVPIDVKICLKPPECPKDFYGVQGQVSQNRGQPYVYFCVIAKTGNEVVRPPGKVTVPGEEPGFFGKITAAFGGDRDREVYETKKDSQVNVLVIRQFADKHGGYITSESDMKRLMIKSLKSAQMTVKCMPREESATADLS